MKEGRLRNLAGFGAKSEERILRGLSVMTTDRVRLDVAKDTATGIVDALRPLTERVAYAGSLRRMRETIGDVDILATAVDDEQAERIMAAFRDHVPGSRSTCGWSGPTAGAPPSSTSPAPR